MRRAPSLLCVLAVLSGFACQEPRPETFSGLEQPLSQDCAPERVGEPRSRVQLDVWNIDNTLYVTVNGVRRALYYYGQDDSRDVTDWFAQGDNEVSLQVVNTGVEASYAVQLRVDDKLVIDEQCSAAPCDSGVGGDGIVFSRKYTVPVTQLPPPTQLGVQGTRGAQIYVNGAYTGRTTPATLALPNGEYVVGLGVGEGVPGAYEGRFHEQKVELTGAPVTITPEQTRALAPNVTRIGVLPIRRTLHGPAGNTDIGELSERDIEHFLSQARVTSREYVEPFSYGLTTWDVTRLATVEDVALLQPDPDDSPDTDRLLREAGLTQLERQYTSIIYLYSVYTAAGQPVRNAPRSFWAIGQSVAFTNLAAREGDRAERPNVFLLHEMLHDYESYNEWILGYHNGVDGLHGAGWHGYREGAGGEEDYLKFYRAYMRNQVAELRSMRSETPWPVVPTQADLWVGVFDTMRRGVQW